MRRRNHLIGMALIALLSVACNAETPSESERVATEVARAKAVAATLTAAAPTVAATQVVAQVVPTDTPLPRTTALPPTRVAPKPPTPTDTPVPQAADQFVPGVGDPRGLKGGILLPDYFGPLDAPVFSDWVNVRLEVFDPNVGAQDGAGIKTVSFVITNPNGDTVVDQREGSAAYCAFANPSGDPSCNVWIFSDHDNQWPTGIGVCEGLYNAQINVETDNPDTDGALWNFQFAILSSNGRWPAC